MPKNKDRDVTWDTDFMISNARSLQRVVKELERNGSISPQSDQIFFSGVFLASPILSTFAIEIALKAWQCREQKKASPRTVVSQFEFLFLYGPRFFGAGFLESIITNTSSHSHTPSVNPACMAGVTRKVL